MAPLPSPDFTYRPGVTPLIAGLRPWRKDTYRLEAQVIGNKVVVHNYGHGGAGITMSWGCAKEVVALVKQHEPHPAGKPVAVLGAGVMGLTAATLLEAEGMTVTIFAKKFPPQTTSNAAGGQWAPSKVAYTSKARIKKILKSSFDEHLARGTPFGVTPRTNYSLKKIDHFELAKDYIPEQSLAHLPFARLNRPGFAYKTLLVEPPIFLKKLYGDLQARPNVQMVRQEFIDDAQVKALPVDILVNCTGLGSDTIWRDDKLVPIKGQLVLLPAQPNLTYLYSGGGYVFPRADYTVVGGTEEYGFTHCEPDPARCAALVDHVKNVFDGVVRRAPSWLIVDE